jgi:hypothetical protein
MIDEDEARLIAEWDAITRCVIAFTEDMLSRLRSRSSFQRSAEEYVIEASEKLDRRGQLPFEHPAEGYVAIAQDVVAMIREDFEKGS